MFRMSKQDLTALVMGLMLASATAAVVAQDANVPAKETATSKPDAAKDANAPVVSPEMASIEGKKADELWRDMLYYVKVARMDLAVAYGKALLDSGVTARELYVLSSKTPDSLTVLRDRAAKNKDLKPIADKILAMIEDGYRADSGDPKQIEEAIGLLAKGNLKSYELGAKRLEDSGELALPQLMFKLKDPNASEALKTRIIALLPRMGKEAVRPLAESLQSDSPFMQEQIAIVLGQIGYPQAAPMLKALLEKPGLSQVTQAAVRSSLLATGGKEALTQSLAEMYYNLAEKYYRQDQSILPDPRFDANANVWYWKGDLGLDYKAVPRPIFCDVYAMRYARMALAADPKLSKAVVLWLAANFKKEAALPAGAKDATRGENQPGVQFYALASSAAYLQDVLARGLAEQSEPLIAGAIDALARTAGAASLTKPQAGGKQPLVEAMTYTDAKIRFMAALTLAMAMPQEKFGGSEAVMPILNDTITAATKDDKTDDSLKAAAKAAKAIEALSVSSNKVFDLLPSAGPLVALLKSAPTDTRLAAAGALAVMPDATAQQALATTGVADSDEKVKIALLGLATDSVRRFGSKLSDEQSAAVLDIVTGKGSNELREAAAQLCGALNLPSEKVKALIIQSAD